jgi:hypothetical protein
MNPISAAAPKLLGHEVLVLGKGPSLTRDAFTSARLGRVVVGINQTSAVFPVDFAFFIDIEPFREVVEALLDSQCIVILPWRPNARTWRKSRSRPIASTLVDLVQTEPGLQVLESQGRLVYFHSRALAHGEDSNVFPPNLVSLSSLLQILGKLGVKNVKTLGVDGGMGVSQALAGSSLRTQLRRGYSKQFPILRKIALSRGIAMERANETPLNIYVGCEPPQQLAARVLEHSILRHTNHPVRVKRLHQLIPDDWNVAGRTPFSMQRFMIPRLNQHRDLSVYMDSDMLVFHDVKELIDMHDPEAVVSSAEAPPGSDRRPQFSVMVIDCGRARWQPEQIACMADEAYESAMFRLEFEPSKSRCLPYQWNSLERYDPDTRLLHFTDMERQPWLSNENQLAPIWMDALFKSIEDKFVSFDDIVQDVQRGWARPGLLWQVEYGERDPLAIPGRERLKDSLYTPPHTVARFSRFNNPPIRASLAMAKRMLNWARGH